MHTLLATYTTSGLGDLDEGLERLRLCDPAADQRMEDSLAIHGQLPPLLVRERRDGYAVLDGFKRLRGARALSWSELQVAVIHVNEAQANPRVAAPLDLDLASEQRRERRQRGHVLHEPAPSQLGPT